jgi:integrase
MGMPSSGDGRVRDQSILDRLGGQQKGECLDPESGSRGASVSLCYILKREIGDLGAVIRARKPKRLPVVMTREEVKAVVGHLTGDKWLMASLMYGAGLRLMECLRLRVKDIDFERSEITVRDGKGEKDRRTMLPASLRQPFQDHLRKVKAIYEKDLAEG